MELWLMLATAHRCLSKKLGSPVRIRTSIDGVRVRSLTIRRPGTIHDALGGADGGVKQGRYPNPLQCAATMPRLNIKCCWLSA